MGTLHDTYTSAVHERLFGVPRALPVHDILMTVTLRDNSRLGAELRQRFIAKLLLPILSLALGQHRRGRAR